MKILGLSGSARPKGNSMKLLTEAIRGANDAGAETEIISLYNMNFKGCRSCFACKRKSNFYGKGCAIKDDFTEVMEHSWAYGSKGNALKGKFFIASMTVGGPEKEYQHDGIVTYTMDEFMAFIKRYTVTCKMEFKKLFCTYGANYIKGVYPEEKYTQVVNDCKKHAAELAEFVKTL